MGAERVGDGFQGRREARERWRQSTHEVQERIAPPLCRRKAHGDPTGAARKGTGVESGNETGADQRGLARARSTDDRDRAGRGHGEALDQFIGFPAAAEEDSGMPLSKSLQTPIRVTFPRGLSRRVTGDGGFGCVVLQGRGCILGECLDLHLNKLTQRAFEIIRELARGAIRRVALAQRAIGAGELCKEGLNSFVLAVLLIEIAVA